MTDSSPSISNRKVRRSHSSSFISTPDINTIPASNYRKPSLPIVTHSQQSIKKDGHQQQRLPMRSSASTRFGKNLLPAWLGRQSQPTQPAEIMSSLDSTSADLETQFESLLDELDMKDDHRQNLRRLPSDQQLYLLQQNASIKNKQSSSTPSPSLSSSTTDVLLPSPDQSSNTAARPTRQKSLLKPVTPRSLFSSHLRKSPSSNAIQSKSIKQPNPTSSSVSSTAHDNSKATGLPSPPPSIDKRAANYKFRRNNMKNSTHANSRVGSMILEFNALAHHDTEQEDESASAWLLLNNKSLDAPSSSQQNSKPDTQGEKGSTTPAIHHSLSRKEAAHISSLINQENHHRNQRERNSPYIYVERLRSRNISLEGLLKYLISLKSNLSNGSDSWVNEFLSRRHDGLSALEHVLERLSKKKK
ncbi:unnamed protein product [Absidia cylindrospora]